MTVWNRYATLFLWHGLRCDGVGCVWVVEACGCVVPELCHLDVVEQRRLEVAPLVLVVGTGQVLHPRATLRHA